MPIIVIVVVVALSAAMRIGMRRRGYGTVGKGGVIVRCRSGHLFTTLWLPLGSLKAVRLGMWRYQYCPVGKHWSLVRPVRESDLTEEQRAAALATKDVRVP